MSSLNGYVVEMRTPSGLVYVKWYAVQRWGLVADPMDASHFHRSQDAMDTRPWVNGEKAGQAVLLRTAVRG